MKIWKLWVIFMTKHLVWCRVHKIHDYQVSHIGAPHGPALEVQVDLYYHLGSRHIPEVLVDLFVYVYRSAC